MTNDQGLMTNDQGLTRNWWIARTDGCWTEENDDENEERERWGKGGPRMARKGPAQENSQRRERERLRERGTIKTASPG